MQYVLCFILPVFMKALVKTPRSVYLVEEVHGHEDMAHYHKVVWLGRLLSFHHHNHALRSSQVLVQLQRSLPVSWFL